VSSQEQIGVRCGERFSGRGKIFKRRLREVYWEGRERAI